MSGCSSLEFLGIYSDFNGCEKLPCSVDYRSISQNSFPFSWFLKNVLWKHWNMFMIILIQVTDILNLDDTNLWNFFHDYLNIIASSFVKLHVIWRHIFPHHFTKFNCLFFVQIWIPRACSLCSKNHLVLNMPAPSVCVCMFVSICVCMHTRMCIVYKIITLPQRTNSD